MPFGISSAPEVWQQKMNEIIEGLIGVEVIADDFLICGFSDNTKDAIINHDNNLCQFLRRAGERGLKLNLDKVKLRLNSVPFIGHLLTERGWLQTHLRYLPLILCQLHQMLNHCSNSHVWRSILQNSSTIIDRHLTIETTST